MTEALIRLLHHDNSGDLVEVGYDSYEPQTCEVWTAYTQDPDALGVQNGEEIVFDPPSTEDWEIHAARVEIDEETHVDIELGEPVVVSSTATMKGVPRAAFEVGDLTVEFE